MTSKFYVRTILFILSAVITSILAADISSNVGYLRKQYNARKNKADKISIQYQGTQIQDGDILKKADTQIAPEVKIGAKTDPQMPFFTLVMIDPDAPKRGNERAGPWLHWIKASFKGNDVNSGTTLADYQGPAPPDGTGPHQYIFLLYKSATNRLAVAGEPIRVKDSNKRKQFRLRKFEKRNNLKLVAATSFTVVADKVKQI